MKTAASCLKNTTMEEVFFSCSNELKKLKIKILTKNFLNNSINGKCELMNLGKFAFYKILLNYDDYISELGGYNIIKNKYKVPKRIDYYVFSECYVILYDFLDEVITRKAFCKTIFLSVITLIKKIRTLQNFQMFLNITEIV